MRSTLVITCFMLLLPRPASSIFGGGEHEHRNGPTQLCLHESRRRKHEYVSSSLEQRWLAGAADHICDIARQQMPEAEAWIQYAKRAAGNRSMHSISSYAAVPGRSPLVATTLLPTLPTDREAMVLSSWMTPGDKQSPLEYIEPLSGMARHPMANLGCKGGGHKVHKGEVDPFRADLMDISDLVLANKCGADGRPVHACNKARNVFFDLGCSVYDDGTTVNVDAGSGIGPSLPLFAQLYEQRCIEFDALYGART